MYEGRKILCSLRNIEEIKTLKEIKIHSNIICIEEETDWLNRQVSKAQKVGNIEEIKT